jgi:hypothetical protein
MVAAYDDTYTKRDEEDYELRGAGGDERHADASAFYLLIPRSSTGSTAAATTFMCEIMLLVNPEDEGAALQYEGTGLMILATNITGTRPVLNGPAVPGFKVGDRIAMVNY